MKAGRSEGLKNDGAKLDEKLGEPTVSHVKQQAATTAVTSLDWLRDAYPLEAAQALRATGQEGFSARLTKESNARRTDGTMVPSDLATAM